MSKNGYFFVGVIGEENPWQLNSRELLSVLNESGKAATDQPLPWLTPFRLLCLSPV